MKKNRLDVCFVSATQYGYLSDHYYFSKYLEKYYDLKLICEDKSYPKIENEIDKLEYVTVIKKKGIYHLDVIYKIAKAVKRNPSSIYFINAFPFCYLLPILFPRRKFILDIRSGGVSHKTFKRKYKDFSVKRNSFIFGKSIILSDSLAKRLKIRNSYVIPLGSKVHSTKEKSFNEMRLFYIGTFTNRNLEHTIEGLGKFIKSFNPDIKISYDIVGFGSQTDIDKINKSISDYDLQEIVKFHGRLNHLEAKAYFDNCNIGISYVPITDFYDVQPPTKTFEYLCSGMIVLGTSTKENLKIVDQSNGVLTKDNSEAVCEGLNEIYKNRELYQSEQIQKDSLKYTWSAISDEIFHPYLTELLRNDK